MKVAADCCRGLWLLLALAWAQNALRESLRSLRASQAAQRTDWVSSDRKGVRFWVRAVRGWCADWRLETFAEEAA